MYGTVSDAISIDLANAVLFTAFAVTWSGARVFDGRRARADVSRRRRGAVDPVCRTPRSSTRSTPRCCSPPASSPPTPGPRPMSSGAAAASRCCRDPGQRLARSSAAPPTRYSAAPAPACRTPVVAGPVTAKAVNGSAWRSIAIASPSAPHAEQRHRARGGGPLLRHGEQDRFEGDGDDVLNSRGGQLKAQHGEPYAVEHLTDRRPRQHLRHRRAEQEHRPMRGTA